MTVNVSPVLHIQNHHTVMCVQQSMSMSKFDFDTSKTIIHIQNRDPKLPYMHDAKMVLEVYLNCNKRWNVFCTAKWCHFNYVEMPCQVVLIMCVYKSIIVSFQISISLLSK